MKYQTKDKEIEIEVYAEDASIWVTIPELVKLFQIEKEDLTRHIAKLFTEGVLKEKNNVQHVFGREADGSQKIYSMDVVVFLGYRLRNVRIAHFRRRGTTQLKAKEDGDKTEAEATKLYWEYFDELERHADNPQVFDLIFWCKILDLYTLSRDYKSAPKHSDAFFEHIEKTIYWAVLGRTPEELVYERINADERFLGLKNFKNDEPNEQEILIAWNYLTASEVDRLEGIKKSYLNIAQEQVKNNKEMHAEDWVSRLEGFLHMNGMAILINKGHVTKEDMSEKALAEFERYHSSE